MKKHPTGLVVLSLLTIFAASAQALEGEQPKLTKEAEAAKDVVTKHLQKIDGLKSNPTVAWLSDKALQEVFPELTFIAVRYRQYPIGFPAPQGLSASNVFAVDKNGKWEVLTEPKALEKFFVKGVEAAKAKVTEKNAGNYARAWLDLWQELMQDGFYGFEIQPAMAEKKDNGIEVKDRSLVTKGGKGELMVTLSFGADQSVKVTPVSKVMPGPRPICQATKLLDPDPIVRHMAESELLFMGVAAKSYLLEQRDKATSPRLRQAIERLLQRIETIGW